jgi:hypothetical protein
MRFCRESESDFDADSVPEARRCVTGLFCKQRLGPLEIKNCDDFSLWQELESFALTCRPQQDVRLANVTPQ